ncbi:MAG: methyltransferase domain-containing protein [Armatimonadetes bacterium]|nr:methyltransferase domain-containing protein [Armatimonadota bacterium]
MDDDAFYFSPAEGFARLADTYDLRLSGNPMLLLETSQTLAALPNVAGKAVADIGCGTGRYAIQLMRLGAEKVAGVDLSPAMLEVAQHKSHRAELPIEWGVGDLAEHIPIPDATLDAAVCALALTFVESLNTAFAELSRVLKPGGVLVVSELHPLGLTLERAASSAVFRKDRAPYLRFTDLQGQECRIARTPHTLADYVNAAYAAGLTLTFVAEPLVDTRLAVTFGHLKEKIGLPLALILRFQKCM